MGDNSPKNQHKLDEQKHEKHIKNDHEKLENAVHQHHPDRPSTPEEILALKKTGGRSGRRQRGGVISIP